MATKRTTTLHPETEPAGKLVILTIVTLGAYYHYWCFKHWNLLKHVQGRNLWPAGRGLLGPLLAPWLYRDLYALEDPRTAASGFRAGLVTLVTVIVLNAAGLVPEAYLSSVVVEVAYYVASLVLLAIFLAGMVLAQSRVNRYWERARKTDRVPLPGKVLFIVALVALYLLVFLIVFSATAPIEEY